MQDTLVGGASGAPVEIRALRVFIVEDDRMVIETYREILRISGFEVVGWSYNGEEAIKKFAMLNPRPDVIIMDHRLPMKNGVETTVEILLIDPSARVLFVSADITCRSSALSIGAAGFLRKPFELKEFVATIKQLGEKAMLAASGR
jgi:DNA-binding NarL/FixJ family response regulator